MLKGVPDILSPELLKILMEMGHGDEIVLADINYPSASHANKLVVYPGVEITTLLPAILQLFPLDTFVDSSFMLMKVIGNDTKEPPVWAEYRKMVECSDKELVSKISTIERNEFYERTKKAYAIVATGETALYGSIILRKGVL